MTCLTIQQLSVAPELGILDTLESTARVTLLTLVSVYPALAEPDVPMTPDVLAAMDVIDCARALCAVINRYKITIASVPFAGDDDPF